jgi:fructose-1,6-bisphosphatase/inositol monophosphatase family enzyme
MSIYHPVAELILKFYQTTQVKLARDLNEIKQMQGSHSKNSDFALKTLTNVCNKVSGLILTTVKNCNFVFNIYDNNFVKKVQATNREGANLRLVFTPIDNLNNFSRGLGFFSSSFVLQKLCEDGFYESVFSLLFTNIDGNSYTIYTQNNENGLNTVYLNQRPIRQHFKTSFAISSIGLNNFALMQEFQQKLPQMQIAKVVESSQNIVVTGSVNYLTSLICCLNLDGLILLNQSPADLLASFVILKNFDFSLNLKNEDFNDLTTQNKINMIALSFECFSKLNK